MGYRSGSVYKYTKSKIWWISYYIDGKRVRESAKTDNKKQAQIFLAKRLADQKIPDKKSIKHLLLNLIRNHEINGRGPGAKLVINAQLMPFFGQMKTDKLSLESINQYIEKRKKEGRANGTINWELTALRTAFNIANIPHVKIPFLSVDNVRKGFVMPEQFEKIMAELPEHLLGVALFAYETGCRRGEILKLQWPQVDLKDQMVRLEPGETKNKKARMIPLSETLTEVLKNLPRVSEWVFTYHGRPFKSFKPGWDAACECAGLPEILFHDLRRTGVRNLVRAGVPERVAMDISGHRSRSVFDRYNITSESDLKDAMKRLESTRTQADRNAAARANRGSLEKFLKGG